MQNFLKNLHWKKFWFESMDVEEDQYLITLAKNVVVAYGIFSFGVIPLHIYVYLFEPGYFKIANPLFWLMYSTFASGWMCYVFKAYKLSFFIIFLGGAVYLYYIASYFGRDSLIYLFLIFNTLTILVVLGREKKLAILCYLTLSTMVLIGHFTDFETFYNPETAVYQSTVANYSIVMLLVVNFLILWASVQNIHKDQARLAAANIRSEQLAEKQKKMQEVLVAKNIELQKYIDSNMQLENFAYVASHDLKEPIRTITSFSQLLLTKNEEQLDEAGQEFLSFIIEAGKNMHALIQDMLTFARINTDEKEIVIINPKALIEEVLRSLGQQIDEKNAHIELLSLPDSIQGDTVKLKQLFQNLIANGIKFHQEGGRPHIIIGAKNHPDAWEFYIRDNGIGISEEFQDKIFMLFRRLHTKAEYTGSGIGLAICKKVVEQHQGKIWVESKEGEGTTMRFTLSKAPLQTENPQEF